jgi:hypothetical protein
LAPTASLQAAAATGCEPFLFLVGQILPLRFGEFDQKFAELSPANLAAEENVIRVRPADRSRDFL